MQEERKNKRRSLLLSLIGWGTFFLGIILIRLFCAESFRISTHSMEDTLHPNDYVLVNKLPLKNNPARNRIILFSSPLLKDSLSSPLFASRCVGMPGDTIEVTGSGYFINGKEYPRPPHSLSFYRIPPRIYPLLQEIMRKLTIPCREMAGDSAHIRLSLTPFEAYQIREELSEKENLVFEQEAIESYMLIVPQKERAYRLDPATLIACREVILRETEGKAVIRDNKLFLDGKETNFFFFEQDYYWVLSDNTLDGIDSRYLGFIPKEKIIGNVFFCWYSKDAAHRFKILK